MAAAGKKAGEHIITAVHQGEVCLLSHPSLLFETLHHYQAAEWVVAGAGDGGGEGAARVQGTWSTAALWGSKAEMQEVGGGRGEGDVW
jgi:hypothetical protein